MSYTFTADRHVARYRLWRRYQLLTSRPVVVLLVAAALAVPSLWLWVLFSTVGTTVLGITLLLSGIAALVSSAYVFAVTYFPYQVPGQRLEEATQVAASSNIAEVSELSLIAAVTEVGEMPAIEGMLPLVQAVLMSSRGRELLARLQLPVEAIHGALQKAGGGMPLAELCERSVAQAVQVSAPLVAIEHVVVALLQQALLRTLLREHDLQESDVEFVGQWHYRLRQEQVVARRWWTRERLVGFTGVGLSWTTGFTPLIDQLSHFPRGNWWDQVLVGREGYVDRLITTLARARQSNVLLVGAPGVGRLGIVRALAARVRTNQAHPALNGQRVVYIPIGEVVAKADTPAGQLRIVSRVLREMEQAGNVIAVIDGLSSIVSEGQGKLDLTSVLLPFFSSLAVRVVVIVAAEEYQLRLKTNEELIHFFEVITVDSISAQATLPVLAFATPLMEQESKVELPYKTLRATVEGTESILNHIPFPERAFDVLEEAIVEVQSQGKRVLEQADIDAVITKKVGIPVGRVREQEREHLLGLESAMGQRIVNQRRAITTVSRAMIRSRTGVRTKARPIGTFLFLGPTGVGKTETAKALAEAYFGTEQYLSRLDMSEFQSERSVEQLIGSANHPVGRLTSLIAERPFAVLLLDEFEKAHRAVHQLFLQVFDEGRLTDARGQTVSFTHAIIIATSNAGAEFIRQELRDGVLPDDFEGQLREHILSQGIFQPELLNRFDGVVTFTPLTPEHIQQVATNMLRALNKRLDAEHGITVAITPELVAFLLKHGFDPQFGARPMTRAIQNYVEYYVADQVLRGATKPGQELTLDVQRLEQVAVK